jgi:hypothetical protein
MYIHNYGFLTYIERHGWYVAQSTPWPCSDPKYVIPLSSFEIIPGHRSMWTKGPFGLAVGSVESVFVGVLKLGFQCL